MFTVEIRMPIDPPSKDAGGWGDTQNFLFGLEQEGFQKSVGSGISLKRTPKGDFEIGTLITDDLGEAVNFLQMTCEANWVGINTAFLNGKPMLSLVWRFYAAIRTGIVLAKRLPGREGVGALRECLEEALEEK